MSRHRKWHKFADKIFLYILVWGPERHLTNNILTNLNNSYFSKTFPTKGDKSDLWMTKKMGVIFRIICVNMAKINLDPDFLGIWVHFNMSALEIQKRHEIKFLLAPLILILVLKSTHRNIFLLLRRLVFFCSWYKL